MFNRICLVNFLFVFFIIPSGITQTGVDLQKDLLHFQEQLRLHPESPDINYNMAQVYFLMGKTDLAIKFLERTVFLEPEDSEARHRLAAIYRKIGRLADARDLLMQAVKLRPDSSDLWYELGIVYSDLAEYKSGISSFNRALHLCRNEEQKFRIIYYTGLLHLSNRDLPALRDCLRRLRPEPEYHRELLKLGRLWQPGLN